MTAERAIHPIVYMVYPIVHLSDGEQHIIDGIPDTPQEAIAAVWARIHEPSEEDYTVPILHTLDGHYVRINPAYVVTITCLEAVE